MAHYDDDCEQRKAAIEDLQEAWKEVTKGVIAKESCEEPEEDEQ